MAEQSVDVHKMPSSLPDVSWGTSHNTWLSGFPSSDGYVTTTTTAFGAEDPKIPTATKPATSAATGRAIFPPGSSDNLRIRFFGTDAADETINYRVWKWRWSEEFQLWIPTLLCKGVITLGTSAFAGVTSGLFAGIVSVTEDLAVGNVKTLAIGTPDNNPVEIQMDFDGAPLIEVEFDLGTAAAAGFLWYTL